MTMMSTFVWRNGTMVSWPDTTFHVFCHALHYGSGVFEGIRSYHTDRGPAVFRLGAHLDRFFASAKVYGMELRYSRQDLAYATLDLIWTNEFTDCCIRPLAFYGSETCGKRTRMPSTGATPPRTIGLRLCLGPGSTSLRHKKNFYCESENLARLMVDYDSQSLSTSKSKGLT